MRGLQGHLLQGDGAIGDVLDLRFQLQSSVLGSSVRKAIGNYLTPHFSITPVEDPTNLRVEYHTFIELSGNPGPVILQIIRNKCSICNLYEDLFGDLVAVIVDTDITGECLPQCEPSTLQVVPHQTTLARSGDDITKARTTIPRCGFRGNWLMSQRQQCCVQTRVGRGRKKVGESVPATLVAVEQKDDPGNVSHIGT
uniref:Uncharacterized protein n=1 Tax=Timema tahoe TaxID=61484 RepID=A0A7R9FM90_9NEOP|nr:unnamed protein product [Timema tahoe]